MTTRHKTTTAIYLAMYDSLHYTT